MTGRLSETPGDAAADDGALMRAVAARDRAAFALIFSRYAGRVKGYLMRAGFSAAEADEGAQEVMLSVWRGAPGYDPARANAATWIFAIARNRRVDMMRRRRPEPDPNDPLFHPAPLPQGESAAAGADRDDAVRTAVEALSQEQRMVVRLAYFDGLSHSEIAEALDTPVGTVKSRLRLAMARLREALGPDFALELFEQ